MRHFSGTNSASHSYVQGTSSYPAFLRWAFAAIFLFGLGIGSSGIARAQTSFNIELKEIRRVGEQQSKYTEQPFLAGMILPPTGQPSHFVLPATPLQHSVAVLDAALFGSPGVVVKEGQRFGGTVILGDRGMGVWMQLYPSDLNELLRLDQIKMRLHRTGGYVQVPGRGKRELGDLKKTANVLLAEPEYWVNDINLDDVTVDLKDGQVTAQIKFETDKVEIIGDTALLPDIDAMKLQIDLKMTVEYDSAARRLKLTKPAVNVRGEWETAILGVLDVSPDDFINGLLEEPLKDEWEKILPSMEEQLNRALTKNGAAGVIESVRFDGNKMRVTAVHPFDAALPVLLKSAIGDELIKAKAEAMPVASQADKRFIAAVGVVTTQIEQQAKEIDENIKRPGLSLGSAYGAFTFVINYDQLSTSFRDPDTTGIIHTYKTKELAGGGHYEVKLRVVRHGDPLPLFDAGRLQIRETADKVTDLDLRGSTQSVSALPITLKYEYSGSHGDAVYLTAIPFDSKTDEGGSSSRLFACDPAGFQVQKGVSSQTLRARTAVFTLRYSGTSELRTDRVRAIMYTHDKRIVTRDFEVNVLWGRQAIALNPANPTLQIPDRGANSPIRPDVANRLQIQSASVAGEWRAQMGQPAQFGTARLTQQGNRVSGSLTYDTSRATAYITGTLQGTKLTFTWQIPNTPISGNGTLNLTNGGKQLSGSYLDSSSQSTGPFTLTRR